jgi:hypothetical protein
LSKTSATSTARKSAHRPLRGVEPLETRAVLSANFGAGASFDLAIQGTDVQFSPMGLPASMAGDVFLVSRGKSSDASIGHYTESLTPIFMDVNDDEIPDFVGTQGVATFTFFVGAAQHGVGSITTVNTSYIQSMTPEGQMLVGSQGTIVASSGILRNLSGGFTSDSTVGLYPSFEMQTNVHFAVNRAVAPVFKVLAIANDLSNDLAARNLPQADDDANEDARSDRGRKGKHEHDSTPAHHARGKGLGHQKGLASANDALKHDSPSRHLAHDRAFADDTDWRLDNVFKGFSLA